MSANYFSIAPHAKFLDTLAANVLDGTLLNGWPQDGPFWLADVTIIVPTRRARPALAEAFLRRLGPAVLLPDIRSFGGEAGDEEPFLPPHDAPALPEAVPPGKRLLAIARLVHAWAQTVDGQAILAAPPNPAEILSLAASLGDVIDDLAIGGVSFSAVSDLPPENLADNWRQVLEFLRIALEFWPARMRDSGRIDVAELRNRRLSQQAAAAHFTYADRPVIAAGSTGSISATAELMKAIAALPRGALVLPGLDTSLTPAEHERLLTEGANAHGHPQYALARLMRRLGTGPAAFVELGPPTHPRTDLVRAALAPAPATAWWAESQGGFDLAAATTGLSTIAAHTADEQALAIALCAREALASGRTVGIVSPDQNLARRIAAALRRFDVAVDDPAGTPLYQSPAGRLARLLLAVAVNRVSPVDLVSLLRHPGAAFGKDRADVLRLTDRLEICLLRGKRVRPGVDGLRHALAENGAAEKGPKLTRSETGEVELLLGQVESAIAPLVALLGAPVTASALAEAIAAAFASAALGTEVSGAAELVRWAAGIADPLEPGPALPPVGLDGVLRVLMEGVAVRRSVQRRDDIAIWGQLEARLQNPDRLILAGLNEDIWPRVADPGPWLNRGMRLALGLEPPEWRQGQAAHDFEMGIGNADAVIAFSHRTGTAPALPSRLVQRLEAFVGDEVRDLMRGRGQRWIAAARALDATAPARPASRPSPRPPLEARPTKLSVTEVETLFRSPYAIYAKHVLGLHKLAPLGEEPDARERGIMVHDVFAKLVEADIDPDAPDAAARLRTHAVEAFAGLAAIGDRRDIWLRRFDTAAAQFLAHERARQSAVRTRHAEIDGTWTLPNGFTLTGRADRIDILADGSAEIIDFKTGSLPKPADMQRLFAPQLPLEAAMLEAGAFESLPPAQTSALTFIRVRLGPAAFVPMAFRTRGGVMAAAAEAGQRLQRHVEAILRSDALPMTADVLPVASRRYRGDYDHLARADEWRVNEGDDSE